MPCECEGCDVKADEVFPYFEYQVEQANAASESRWDVNRVRFIRESAYIVSYIATYHDQDVAEATRDWLNSLRHSEVG